MRLVALRSSFRGSLPARKKSVLPHSPSVHLFPSLSHMGGSFIYKSQLAPVVKACHCCLAAASSNMKMTIYRGNEAVDAEDDRYRAPALDKGLDILEQLASVDGGLTQAEISRKLGRSPNEFYRMLDRLVRRGYVTRIDGDRYSLTLKLFGLAQLHAPTRRLASYATPLMRDLAQRSRQANQLAVFDRGSAVIIAQQEAPDYWGISIRVGSHVSLFDTGSAMCCWPSARRMSGR